MDTGNPYAPPQAQLNAPRDPAAPDPAADLPPWLLEDGRLLVRHRVKLPDICLFTGEPTTPAQRLSLPLSWTPAWFRIVAVFAPFPAVFAYGVIRKTSSAEIGLGPAGRKRRRLCLTMTLLAVIAAMLIAYLGLDQHEFGAPLGLLALCFVAFLIAALSTRVFRVVGIDHHYAHLAVRPAVAKAFALARPPEPPVR